MKIGIFDSGIGGLNVLHKLIEKHPHCEYIYYGDTVHLPYGEKTKEQLLGYGRNIISFFEKKNVDLIVIACGTCSAFLEEFQKGTMIPIIDCITPTVERVGHHYSSVALLATEATVHHHVFENKLRECGVQVQAIACPLFVPLLEQGKKEEIDVTEYLSFIHGNVEAIILGCTHYPLLKDKMQQVLSQVSYIDMGESVSDMIHPNDGLSGIEIYYSKIDPILLRNTESIIPYNKKITLQNL